MFFFVLYLHRLGGSFARWFLPVPVFDEAMGAGGSCWDIHIHMGVGVEYIIHLSSILILFCFYHIVLHLERRFIFVGGGPSWMFVKDPPCCVLLSVPL